MIQRRPPCRRVQRTYAATRGPGPRWPAFGSTMAVLRGGDGRLRAVSFARTAPARELADAERDGERVDASQDDVDDPVMIEVHGGAAHPHVEKEEKRAP